MDNRQSTIHEYKKDGSYVRSIGSQGQGPGELMNPSQFDYDRLKNQLVVQDGNNGRYIWMDPDGKVLESIRREQQSSSFTFYDGHFYSVMTRMGDRKRRPDAGLIEDRDKQGTLQNSFGSYYRSDLDLVEPASRASLKVSGNKLYALSHFYPLLRVYSLDGRLEKTIEFDELKDEYEDLVPGNYKWDEIFEADNGMVRTKYLFKTFDVTDEGIFLSVFGDYLRVDHFSLDGDFLKRYSFPTDPDSRYHMVDMEIHQDHDGETYLYTLDLYPIPQVRKFRTLK